MTNELTAPERRYQTLIAKLAERCSNNNKVNLKLYHGYGEIFAEFLNGLSADKYGSASVDQLAQDLCAKGAVPSGIAAEPTSLKRYLYWSKSIYDSYPDFHRLEELSDLGFTVTHAKKLFSLSRELREVVESRMIVDGRVVSTRQFEAIVDEVSQRAIADNSAAAAQAAAAARTAPAEAAAAPAEDVAEDGADGDDEGGTDNEPGPAEVAAAAPAQNTAAPQTGRPTNPAQEIANPIKVIKETEKAVTRANAKLPDAFIAVRQIGQTGFDSEAAHSRYLEQLRNTRTAVQAFLEPAQELLRNIDSELGAAEVPVVDQ